TCCGRLRRVWFVAVFELLRKSGYFCATACPFSLCGHPCAIQECKWIRKERISRQGCKRRHWRNVAGAASTAAALCYSYRLWWNACCRNGDGRRACGSACVFLRRYSYRSIV